MAVQIQLRRGTAAQWTSADPTLANGEVGLETDTSKIKIGNGSDAWSTLSYASFGALLNIVEDTTPQLGGALDGQGNDLNNLGVVFLTEQAAAEADVAGKGQIWVLTATPNELRFTNDAGTDFTFLFTADLGSTVQAYDADTLKADTADQLTAAFTTAIDDDGTQSSGTYTPSVGAGSNTKKIVNGGAFTLAPPSPSNNEAIVLDLMITNNASAGAITTSGFTVVTGDSFTTTNGHDFDCTIKVYDIGGTEYSHLHVDALQ